MTAYAANYLKRKRTFAKREEELIHAIRHGHTPDKLARAAEKLREAKLHVFKAEFAKENQSLPPSMYEPRGAALEWRDITVQEIVAKYADRIH